MTEQAFIKKWSARFPNRLLSCSINDLELWTWMLFYDVAKQDYEHICSLPTAQEIELANDYMSLNPLDGDTTHYHCRYIQNRVQEIGRGDLP